MEQGSGPKWQKEVEGILRDRYQGDELPRQLETACELINLAANMKPPHGNYEEVIVIMTKLASEELPPLAATYTGFMLGVAWERLQNANRA